MKTNIHKTIRQTATGSFALPALIAALNLIPAGRVTAQTFTTLHSFTAGADNGGGISTNRDGANPYAGLIANSSGNTLFGTAQIGGSSGNGTVFAVNTDGTGFTNLHNFTAGAASFPYTNSDGRLPVTELVLSGNTLYGVADQGGSSDNGTVFKLNTNGTGFTNLHSFTDRSGPSFTNGDGVYPQGLILSGNTLYGTASYGGSAENGAVFSLSFRPQLTITPSGVPPSGIILSWPTNVAGFDYTGYKLQSAPAPTGPFANLSAATNPYTNLITGPQQFFRLSQ